MLMITRFIQSIIVGSI